MGSLGVKRERLGRGLPGVEREGLRGGGDGYTSGVKVGIA